LKKTFFFILVFGQAFGQELTFEAKGLLYLQDADHQAFSYAKGVVEKDKNFQDKLGSVMFPLKANDSQNFLEQSISNSVVNNKKCVAIKSDNRICYVLETRSSFKKEDSGVTTIRNMADGNYVSVLDISNLRVVKPDYKFPVATNPTGISLSKNNDYLAVSAENYAEGLQVFELNEFGKPIRIIQKPPQIGNGPLIDVEWHPSGDFLAFIKRDTKEVGLIKAIKDGPSQKIVRLELWKFTKDGKYFIILDQKQDYASTTANHKGQVFVLKFNFEEATNHFLISKTEVEENPSGLSIHPSDAWVLVTNMKQSFDNTSNLDKIGKSSVSILSLTSDGNINNLTNVFVEGIMPSGIAFDRSGNNFAMGIFQHLNWGKPFGGISFYRFSGSFPPKIEKQSANIFLNKGLHAIKVIEDF
jgi:6-phosphogluconolactonase (cycloisomerase 2 family)